MLSGVYTTVAWAAVAIIASWLLAHTWLGKSLNKTLRLEIPKSPLPAECCPSCCPRKGEHVLETRAVKLMLEKHFRESSGRQKELVDAFPTVCAALHDVSDSVHALARELMRENQARRFEMTSLQDGLGDQHGKLVDLVEGLYLSPRQSMRGANPGERRKSL
ncbi:hypothetical protein GGR51DRAFT_554699 [Nemania sp. FL0031]|nr:hypothetical protein GGR51DRAFT_554699 [Nemania sp. FL0031]